jgi:hypothetical protein
MFLCMIRSNKVLRNNWGSIEFWPNVEGEHNEEFNEGWEDVLNQNIKNENEKKEGEKILGIEAIKQVVDITT